MVGDTHDRNLLKSARIKALFNEDKHKITHYLKDLEPSTRNRSRHEDGLSFASISENKKESRTKSSKGKKSEKGGQIAMKGLEGDIFKFTNKDRYKTK